MNIDPDSIKIILTGNSITAQIGEDKKTFRQGNAEFPLAQQCALKQDWEELLLLIRKDSAAESIGLKIEKERVVTPEGTPAHSTLEERISDGYPIKTLQAFKKNCDANEWPTAIPDLLCFLKDKNLPLKPNGKFLAWKSVRRDYLDHHSGSFDNHVGAKPKMKREDCEASRRNPCGRGFHAGTFSFASGFCNENQRLIVVEVNPKDVTSVPLDSGEQKLRCDTYEVIAEFFKGEYPEEKRHEEATAFIAKLGKRTPAKDQDKVTTAVKRRMEKKHGKPEKEKEQKSTPPTKKEILAYAFHLKSTKKGDQYTAKMVDSKFKNGIKILKGILRDKKNPQRINKTQREVLTRILQAIPA